jgi:hypothetical protein
VAHTLAKLAVVTVARIGECQAFGHIRPGQGAQLLQGDLGFVLEYNLLRNSRSCPAFAIRDSILGHTEPIRQRKTGMGGGYRHGHGALGIVLFSQLSAMLSRHPYGRLILLGNPGVNNDPCRNRPLNLNLRQGTIPNRPHRRVITPRCLGNKVM